MNDLKAAFESAGFKNVKTVLTSGNVVFETDNTDPDVVTLKIEAFLKKKWKKEIPVFVRSIDELDKMVAGRPFKGSDVTPNTRLYVTFLYEFSRGIKIPELPPNVKITRMKDDAVFTTVELTNDMNSPDSMEALNKVLGPKITARNWNTVEKVLRAATTE